MKFGASSWPFQWDAPYEDAIRRIAGLGFKAIELIAWDRGYDFLNEYYTPTKIKELKSLLDSEGLTHSEFVSTSYKLASPEPQKRKEGVDRFKRSVDVASALGAPGINTVAC